MPEHGNKKRTLEILNGEDLLEATGHVSQTAQTTGNEQSLGVPVVSQNPHALVLPAHSGIASPQNRIWVIDSGHCLQHLNAQWSHTCKIPHLSLRVVNTNGRMGEELMLQDPINRVVRGGAHTICTSSKKAKRRSPSFLCTTPSSSSHKHEDADPKNWSTKGIAESPPSTVKKPSNIAWRDTTSNAPMPSIDTTVAVWS